jgi:hypothetical protein
VIKRLLQFIEQFRYGARQSSLPDGFPFWGFTDPRIGDLSVSDRPVSGHTPRLNGPGDWRCACGRKLAGNTAGNGRAAAREAMRLHRLDLNHPEHAAAEISAPGTEMETADAA